MAVKVVGGGGEVRARATGRTFENVQGQGRTHRDEDMRERV
jgi:hypothetical protein